MKNNKPVGGFLELEISLQRHFYHHNGLGFSNGRTCLNVILNEVRPENVYVPFYCCDSLLSPLKLNNINFTFYSIDENFEPVVRPKLGEKEMFLYINYFGIKQGMVQELVKLYGNNVIIDNSQDYFGKKYDGGWSFNSARKFFGVPDGAYLYSPVDLPAAYETNRNFITDHLVMRLDGRQQEAFQFFKKNEEMQTCQPFLISNFSRSVLSAVDYEDVALKRKANYDFYHGYLTSLNRLNDTRPDKSDAPFCYPFLPESGIDLSFFYKEDIYIPMLWKDVIERPGDAFLWEKEISSTLLCLPVDQRYSKDDLLFIVKLIKERTK